jgi:hypothetical protein
MAYARGAGGSLQLDTPSNERAGAGGVYTNIRDLLRWDENFYDARVGGRGVIERLHTTEPLNDGKPSPYAWGLQIDSYRGLPIVEHGGSLGGYRAHLLRFPTVHASIAILCNLGSIAPSGLSRQVANAVIGDRFTQSSPPAASTSSAARGGSAPTVPARDAKALSAYAGSYYSGEIESTFTIALDAGQLMLRRDSESDSAPLQPEGPDRFRARGMTIRFERQADGAAVLLVDAGRVRDIRFVRADSR